MKKLSIVALSLALGACSTVVPQQRLVQSTYESIPAWYVSTPKDDKIVYGAGTATAPDIQFAKDIAVLNAKVTLADRLESRLSGQIKQYQKSVGDNIVNDTSKTIRNVIAEADVAGYRVDKVVIQPEGAQYRVYTLLSYSEEEAFKILNYRLNVGKDSLTEEAFDELDKVVAATNTSSDSE